MPKRTKQELVELLKKILLDLFDEKYVNRWIESRDRPITKIIQEHLMQANYSCAIIEELEKGGFMEHKDFGVRMSYRVIGDVIPDFDVMAEKIYTNYLQRKYLSTEFDGYKSSSADDLRPKKRKYNKRENVESGKAVVVCKKFELMDKVYILSNDTIFEGSIVGMELDLSEIAKGEKVRYRVKTANNVIYTERIFCTIEGVFQYMKVKLIKYDA